MPINSSVFWYIKHSLNLNESLFFFGQVAVCRNTKPEEHLVLGATSVVKTMLKTNFEASMAGVDNPLLFTMFFVGRIFWLVLRSANMKSFEELSPRGVKAVYDASLS